MPEMPADEDGRVWWRDGVLYQIYPRSYMDSNADGVGSIVDLSAMQTYTDQTSYFDRYSTIEASIARAVNLTHATCS